MLAESPKSIEFALLVDGPAVFRRPGVNTAQIRTGHTAAKRTLPGGLARIIQEQAFPPPAGSRQGSNPEPPAWNP